MADDITITIDGKEVTAKPGTNVLQAAMDNGFYVPYLCYYPGMKSFGACRMCVVEIDGPRGTATLASCTVPVGPDMVVRTKTELRNRPSAWHHGPADIGAPARMPELPPY